MACESYRQQGQSLEQRNAEIKKKLKELEQKLRAKSVSLGIGPNGSIVFRGWKKDDRGGISDACAFRVLSAEGSWDLRQAIAKAESESGRKVNVNAVAAGHHSHDGGKTWGPGHGDGHDH
jgi:hypothetical protein